MAPELDAYDELKYTMVNGESFRRRVPVGDGRLVLEHGTQTAWVSVDDETRIQADKIVSIELDENAHDIGLPLIG